MPRGHGIQQFLAGYGGQIAANSNQTGARGGVPIDGGDTLQGILSAQETQG